MTLDGVTMLRYGVLSGSPNAQVTGTIEFDGGCIWLRHIDVPGARELVLWPPVARLDNSGGPLRIVIGDLALGAGDGVTMGGGEYTGVGEVEHLVGKVPTECVSELYWLATTVKPGLTDFDDG